MVTNRLHDARSPTITTEELGRTKDAAEARLRVAIDGIEKQCMMVGHRLSVLTCSTDEDEIGCKNSVVKQLQQHQDTLSMSQQLLEELLRKVYEAGVPQTSIIDHDGS